MTHNIKLFMFLLTILMTYSCANRETEGDDSSEPVKNEEITSTGNVQAVEFGKDGYTANIITPKGVSYKSLISIVNLGGPDNYTQMDVGDKTTLRGTNDVRGGQNYLQVSKIVDMKAAEPIIYSKAYGGIFPGQEIAKLSYKLKKDQLKNGEGDFLIYRFTKEETVAYCMADPRDANLLGNIYITSTPAKTEQGIQVGSTFGDLKAKYPDIEVNGSEVEGRTYANKNNLSYRLAVPNFSYEVDESKIPLSTKITEIIINR